MPGAFDFFGRFETSLRTYSKDVLPQCPHGVHSPEECECDRHHECKRPHCSNDIPLDPLCKLSQGTPYGVPISMWSYHKCHSGGCDSQDTIKSANVISGEVTERLYSTPTRSSTAKLRTGSTSARYTSTSTIPNDDPGETSDDSSGVALTERSLDTTASPSSSLDCKEGPRLVSQLITARPPGNHNQTRKDGISPTSSRRSLSARGRCTVFNQRIITGNSCKRSQSSCATPSIKNKVMAMRNGHRFNESDVATSSEPPSSPDVSPENTPALTPRKVLSPRNSGNQSQSMHCPTRPVGSTPRAAVARPSAVFAGGLYKVKPAPLNKSASDGVERLRLSFRRGKCNGTAAIKNEATKPGNVRREYTRLVIPPSIRTRLTRVASDSRVDELLTHAHMVLETLTPEQDSSVRSHCSQETRSAPHPQPPITRKLSGGSYKDLANMIHRKMDEMNQALVSSLDSYREPSLMGCDCFCVILT